MPCKWLVMNSETTNRIVMAYVVTGSHLHGKRWSSEGTVQTDRQPGGQDR